ncbi:ABC transporter ATP-binding protein [Actinobacillus indolicus]|uniref:ABC transporter ATP-binding protein n=1 Tax=Actinobacillus indolicus TaxID=51049 RepID=A0A4P7CLV0_9PAST|nr:ABC transporter ATP-binding protein [Actinobacillus indolicus]QBQ64499.1 ABC transporter ATP-binding protein [Actinobacillus indolicus]
MIKLENVSLAFGLSNISCHVSQGKLIGIMGANGAGKSTLLKSIAGILPLTSGEIWLGNCKLSEMTAKQKSEQLAYFAQNTQIHWDLSVYDVIALGLTSPTKNEQAKVRSVSEQFSISHLLEKPFQQLSGGEKARVQLARCCIKQAPLLLADEPIAPLDPYYQIDMMEQLKALTPQKTCVVAIHHLDLAYRFCDEIILLHQGKIIASDQTARALTSDNLRITFGIEAVIDKQNKQITSIQKYHPNDKKCSST